jgi:metal-responsive CopG/Arc/MetJ family transcriptional regulator
MADNETSSSPERIQVNVRVDGDLIKSLDEKRIQLLKQLGSIPSRSEVIRMALEDYLSNKK